jgi:hypothetical protein
VDDHGSLRVSTDYDLGIGALAESLLNEFGHDGATVGAELSVTLCMFC